MPNFCVYSETRGSSQRKLCSEMNIGVLSLEQHQCQVKNDPLPPPPPALSTSVWIVPPFVTLPLADTELQSFESILWIRMWLQFMVGSGSGIHILPIVSLSVITMSLYLLLYIPRRIEPSIKNFSIYERDIGGQ